MSTRILVALGTVIMLAGCAQANNGSSASSSPSSPPSASSRPSLTPVTSQSGKPPAGGTTLTGRVERMDIEGGCTVLRTDSNKTYELHGGDPAIVKAGNRVTVTGKVRDDMATVCQVGPVFEVISSQLA